MESLSDAVVQMTLAPPAPLATVPPDRSGSPQPAARAASEDLSQFFFRLYPDLLRIADFLVQHACETYKGPAPDLATRIIKKELKQFYDSGRILTDSELFDMVEKVISAVTRSKSSEAIRFIGSTFPSFFHEGPIELLNTAIAKAKKKCSDQLAILIPAAIKARFILDQKEILRNTQNVLDQHDESGSTGATPSMAAAIAASSDTFGVETPQYSLTSSSSGSSMQIIPGDSFGASNAPRPEIDSASSKQSSKAISNLPVPSGISSSQQKPAIASASGPTVSSPLPTFHFDSGAISEAFQTLDKAQKFVNLFTCATAPRISSPNSRQLLGQLTDVFISYLQVLKPCLTDIARKVLWLNREKTLLSTVAPNGKVAGVGPTFKADLVALCEKVAKVCFFALVLGVTKISSANIEKSVSSIYEFFRREQMRESLNSSVNVSISSSSDVSLTSSMGTNPPPASPTKVPMSQKEYVAQQSQNVIIMMIVIFNECGRIAPISGPVMSALMAADGFSGLTSPLLGLFCPQTLNDPSVVNPKPTKGAKFEFFVPAANLAHLEDARRQWLKHFSAMVIYLLKHDAIRVSHVEQHVIQLLTLANIRSQFRSGIWTTLMEFIQEYHSPSVVEYLSGAPEYSLQDFSSMVFMFMRSNRMTSDPEIWARLKVVFKQQFDLGIFSEETWMRRDI
jgi:hypothetical protein